MNGSNTVVGVDIAKRVFQLHWIEMETGEIVRLQLKREKFLYLASAGPYTGPEGRDRLLAERVESLVSQEHAAWAEVQRASTEAGAA